MPLFPGRQFGVASRQKWRHHYQMPRKALPCLDKVSPTDGAVPAAQVCVHTDEEDMAALFLYRKLSKEPIMEPMMMPGPDIGASEATMTVRKPQPSKVFLPHACERVQVALQSRLRACPKSVHTIRSWA